MHYIDQASFTQRVYDYVCKLNPIKFYNEIYRYHTEEIAPIPVKDEKWFQSCDVYFEFKNKALEKSKKKREENRAKLNLDEKTNYDERITELYNWKLEVLSIVDSITSCLLSSSASFLLPSSLFSVVLSSSL